MNVIVKGDRHGPFPTADGSTKVEIAGPHWTAAQNQTLAEITLDVDRETRTTVHADSEELLFFIAGHGRVRCGGRERDVGAGDCVVVPPRTEHMVSNTGGEQLVWLSCCAPPYRHETTLVVTE
jgi:mannose-6-phosphate isomerase-like protein (cupin superfamily)